MWFPPKDTYARYLVLHFAIWTWVLIFWNLMRFLGQEVNLDHAPYTFPTLVQLHLSMGLIGSLIFGSLDYFLKHNILRKVPFGRAIVIGSLGYLISTLLLVTLGMGIFTMIQEIDLSWNMYYSNVFTTEIALMVFYCFQVGFVINFVREVDKKFGPGNLWRMLRGEFHIPKEDERIFMFLDLKSSTSIAENLGHIRYSQLIQNCFKDLDVIQKYKAEIYQYVGDEVVLTWPKNVGLSNLNCIRTFFEFKEKLQSRSEYYNNNYGIIPQFKAGLNVGKIVVAEVGEIKTEIAYHGDTINTAARIQGECNRLQSDILISEDLVQLLNQESTLKTEQKDKIKLRGKRQEINLYSVQLRTN